jgi:hypothetical protein
MPRTSVAAIAIAATLTAVAPAEARTCGVRGDMSMLLRAGVFDLRVENVRCAAAPRGVKHVLYENGIRWDQWPSAIIEPRSRACGEPRTGTRAAPAGGRA